ILMIPFMIFCQNPKTKSFVGEPLIENFNIGDCDIKTTNRPDGNVIKYFNPMPIIQNERYDIALSLYFNETTSTYFISTTVLFKKMEVKYLTGDLIIQTDTNDGIQLEKVLNKDRKSTRLNSSHV